MEDQNNMLPADDNCLGSAVSEIRELLDQSRRRVAVQVNQELLSTYWQIGEIIVRYEQNERAAPLMVRRHSVSFPEFSRKNWGRDFSAQIFRTCGFFI